MTQDFSRRLGGDQELRAALEEKEVLFSELEHRTRNTLQMIVGFLALAARRAEHPETKGVLRDVIRRVEMIDAAERALFNRDAVDRVDLGTFLPHVVRELMALDGREGVRLNIGVEPVETSVRQASALGMVINELATNALKHAFPNDEGVLSLELRGLGCGRTQAVIADNGIGLAAAPGPAPGGGLGTQLIEGLCRQAGAELSVTSTSGTRAVLVFATDPSTREAGERGVTPPDQATVA